jgi:uncharacterized lipoprotein
MNLFIASCVLMLLSGCASLKTPKDYSNDRDKEDSINWEYSSRNNMMDSPDGGNTFNSRNMNFIGVTY